MEIKLSIVIYLHSKENHIPSLLRTIFHQKNLNIEVIVVDVSKSKNIDFLYEEFFDLIQAQKLKLVLSTHASPLVARRIAFSYVEGDYVLFLYDTDKVKSHFLERVISILTVIKIDILEFNVKHVGHFATEIVFESELEKNKVYEVQQRPSLFAFISPFIYTKIFSVNFLKLNDHLISNDENGDSYILYLLFSLAATYYYIDEECLTIRQSLNIKDLEFWFSQWNFIIRYFQQYTSWEVIRQYIEYAYIKNMFTYFLKAIYFIETEPNIQKQWEDKVIETIIKEFPTFKINVMLKKNQAIQKMKLYKKLITIIDKLKPNE